MSREPQLHWVPDIARPQPFLSNRLKMSVKCRLSQCIQYLTTLRVDRAGYWSRLLLKHSFLHHLRSVREYVQTGALREIGNSSSGILRYQSFDAATERELNAKNATGGKMQRNQVLQINGGGNRKSMTTQSTIR